MFVFLFLEKYKILVVFEGDLLKLFLVELFFFNLNILFILIYMFFGWFVIFEIEVFSCLWLIFMKIVIGIFIVRFL